MMNLSYCNININDDSILLESEDLIMSVKIKNSTNIKNKKFTFVNVFDFLTFLKKNMESEIEFYKFTESEMYFKSGNKKSKIKTEITQAGLYYRYRIKNECKMQKRNMKKISISNLSNEIISYKSLYDLFKNDNYVYQICFDKNVSCIKITNDYDDIYLYSDSESNVNLSLNYKDLSYHDFNDLYVDDQTKESYFSYNINDNINLLKIKKKDESSKIRFNDYGFIKKSTLLLKFKINESNLQNMSHLSLNTNQKFVIKSFKDQFVIKHVDYELIESTESYNFKHEYNVKSSHLRFMKSMNDRYELHLELRVNKNHEFLIFVINDKLYKKDYYML